MTRAEHRAKCIEAMDLAHKKACYDRTTTFMDCMTAAFDALHGIARVNPIEATEEMVNVVYLYAAPEFVGYQEDVIRSLWGPMASTGDLTNPPETNT